MSSFSKRQGIVPEKEIQIESMDDALRNSLWNALYIYFWSHRKIPRHAVGPMRGDFFGEQPLTAVIWKLWFSHWKLPLDSIPKGWNAIVSVLEDHWRNSTWYGAYDLIEFMAPMADWINQKTTEKFIVTCNNIMEEESSGYRFVGKLIAPIVNKEEIVEVNTALSTPHDAISIQLESALAKLSDRKSPDYRNSIKESISAVETVVNLINGTDDKTLGDALKKISKVIDLHPALANGLSSIYGFTSDDKGGIRHAMMEKTEITSADARFMLVSCSAFINYLIAKAEQANISLSP